MKSLSFVPLFCYEVTRAASNKAPLHNHPFFELVYYETGRGFTTIAKRKYAYEPGMVAFLPPFTPHDEYSREESRIRVLNFKAELQAPLSLCPAVYADRERALLGRMEQLQREMTENAAYSREMSSILCAACYYTLLRGAEKKGPGSLDDAAACLRKTDDEPVSIEALASLCGYSPRHFRQVFRRERGCSPSEYRLRFRLEQAKGMLVYTDEHMTTIASHCGFCTASQFSALFRRAYGLSPSAFRQQERGNHRAP